MDGLDLGSADDEVACGLDVDHQVIPFDLADGADFLAALLEENMVADTDFKIMFHVELPPCVRSLPLPRQMQMRVSCPRTGMHLASSFDSTMEDLERLRAKLCRELAQSERSADVHTGREARRLGDVPPARALFALGEHARFERPRFDKLACRRQPERGLKIARFIGEMFSIVRNLIADRIIDTERSFRGTLLGFRHGVDITRLLREVAIRMGDAELLAFCDSWMERRLPLVHDAERQLAWFAEVPKRALQSGMHAALAPR